MRVRYWGEGNTPNTCSRIKRFKADPLMIIEKGF